MDFHVIRSTKPPELLHNNPIISSLNIYTHSLKYSDLSQNWFYIMSQIHGNARTELELSALLADFRPVSMAVQIFPVLV